MHSNKIQLRFVIVASALLLLSSAIVLAEHLSSADKDKRSLLTLEDRWLASEDDPDALKNILADDFIHALPMGFVTKDEQLSYMRKIKNRPQHGARHFEDMHIRIYGDVGIVNGIVVENAGNDVHKTVFTDVFVHRRGGWEAVNAQESPFQQQSIRSNP